MLKGGYLVNGYCWELSMFKRIRNVKDGISFYESCIEWDRYKADHNPKFRIFLMLFNFVIIEAEIFNSRHVVPDVEDWDDAYER